jgi:hypothetical protein
MPAMSLSLRAMAGLELGHAVQVLLVVAGLGPLLFGLAVVVFLEQFGLAGFGLLAARPRGCARESLSRARWSASSTRWLAWGALATRTGAGAGVRPRGAHHGDVAAFHHLAATRSASARSPVYSLPQRQDAATERSALVARNIASKGINTVFHAISTHHRNAGTVCQYACNPGIFKIDK